MRIQRYSDRYEKDVRRLVREFQDESLAEYGLTFNNDALTHQIEALKDEAFLVVIDDKAQGLLAGKEVYTPASNDKVWHEVIWYVSKPFRKYGIRLLETAKKVLKVEGYTAIVMVYMHNSKSDKLDKLYRRLGYTPMETNFIGRL